MKRTACSLALLLLAAGTASGQTQSTTPDAAAAVSDNGSTPPPADASPPNVADHPGGAADTPAGPGTPLPGVTITKRTKPCGKADVACREEISAEIWRKYPDQIATMCKNERIRSFRQGFDEVELGADPSSANYRLTPQTEALCDYGPAHGLAAK